METDDDRLRTQRRAGAHHRDRAPVRRERNPPAVARSGRSGAPPSTVLDAAHELGLVANALPEAHGGGGERSAMTGALIAEELGWGDLAIALAILSPGLTGFPSPISEAKSAESRYFRVSWAIDSCPDPSRSSSPASISMSFTPRRPPSATATSSSSTASSARCPGSRAASTSSSSPADDGLAAFVVPRTRGLSDEPELKLGLDGLPTVELTLSGVRVAAAADSRGDAGCGA